MPVSCPGRWLAVASLLSPCLLCCPGRAIAHPLASRYYERTILVHLSAHAVIVDYQLDLDETTALLDLTAAVDRVELAKLTTRDEIRQAFPRCYAPILADNLVATLDDRPLSFRCVSHGYEMLDHLRCHFRFLAHWRPTPEERHSFTFRDGTYETEAGLTRLSLVASSALRLEDLQQPDPALQARPAVERKPSDDDRLREARATFSLPTPRPTHLQPRFANKKPVPGTALGRYPSFLFRAPQVAHVSSENAPSPSAVEGSETAPRDLLDLLLDSRQGLLVVLFLAACFGGAHALTPGHGKTLVAAYLVGERGTVWHALLLGLVTTLTHTGAILLLAALLPLFFPHTTTVPPEVRAGLELGAGLIVACMGFWLLLRRLAGQADHVHLGGHGHHHHSHDHHHSHLPTVSKDSGWGRLILLGISGGMVPCGDAVPVFFFALASGRLWLGLQVLLAFSAGLAGVLIALGILVVRAKGYAVSRWGESRRMHSVIRALPTVSAALVTAMGLWLCYSSVHPQ
jgi:ABC-type nickel/cobalt efflux system permease component RcnA